jgi:hypothetical protein
MIRDVYRGSRIQGAKKHWIPDPVPQHWIYLEKINNKHPRKFSYEHVFDQFGSLLLGYLTEEKFKRKLYTCFFGITYNSKTPFSKTATHIGSPREEILVLKMLTVSLI